MTMRIKHSLINAKWPSIAIFTLLVTALYLVSSRPVLAHSGRTDRFGGHNCYVDYCYGEYHYHNDGYTPVSAPVVVLPKLKYPSTLRADVKPDRSDWNSCAQDVFVSWSKVSGATGYKVGLSKSKSDSSDMESTSKHSHKFSNIEPGRWYVKVMADGSFNHRDSDTAYISHSVPKPVPISEFDTTQVNDRHYVTYDLFCIKKVAGPSFFSLNYSDRGKGRTENTNKASKELKFDITTVAGQTRTKTVDNPKYNFLIGNFWYFIGGSIATWWGGLAIYHYLFDKRR